MVKAWRELVTIPTYETGAPEANPIFLEKRVYQGSSGVVYPYPVIESIANKPTPKEWNVVFLENEYLKVMVMPELGGRIQMAYDKLKQRHFVYYNHVIKPALVGLAGPWISGGIEFNWPQHHRPSTYLPVDCDIEEHADGSVTVWCNEMERMFDQQSSMGFRLRPGCAYLEINVRLFNRSELPQTFLWWANPAVAVNDAYQSVFPPDINAVFDHGKRAVSSFPIATGTYYKMDYSAGVDISNYKNIKVPTSYMGVNSKYNFEGGYENDTQGGMLHVANHHVSPGKKQWTWGNGDFGRAWDRNLTDEDGPYIELMAGVYTENQPDFTWIQPYEEKTFTQYFMPYRELGIVKQASKDFIFNINPADGDAVRFQVLATSRQEVRIVLKSDSGTVFYDQKVTLSPEQVMAETVTCPGVALSELTVDIRKATNNGERSVLQWHAEPDEVRPIPDAAEAARLPEECKSSDELYFTGLHLEQYRHATWSALDYYDEALLRDPKDVRALQQLGLWYLRRGRFQRAEGYLRQAVKVLMRRNPNPYNSEALYFLGLALKYQGRTDEAYDWFYKATWSGAQQAQAYFACAQISTAQGRYDDALHELERALVSGFHNSKARALKAAVLRLTQRTEDAAEVIAESLKQDRFNYGCLYEKYLLTKDEQVLSEMEKMMHGAAFNYNEIALDYAAAGLKEEAEAIWRQAIKAKAATPMTYYYLGHYEEAEAANSDFCFPNRLEDIVALEAAKRENPKGAKAPYLLGCLYYDKRQYDVAIENWELSAKLNPQYPTVWRNLALAAYNKQADKESAVALMERAFHLNENDARILMELDQLYKATQRPHAERLAFLQRYPTLIARRDDLVLEEITLLNQVGRYAEAMEKLDAHQFHPWEGGEGKVSAQYQICRVELAKQVLKEQPEKAIPLLTECLDYPHHLGEGKLYGAQENDFYYLLGVAYDALGQKEKAVECWREATKGPEEPAAAMYYNDAKPDKIFYAGLAYLKLQDEAAARRLFHRLVDYGEKHLFDVVRMDYFAVSLPDLLIWDGDLQLKNTIHCKLMMALGHIGLHESKSSNGGNHQEKGLHFLEEVERLDINHAVPSATRTLLPLL